MINLHVKEHLGDYEVGPSVNFGLEVVHLLSKLCIPANHNDFFAILICESATSPLLSFCKSLQSTLNLLDCIRVPFRVSSHAHGEVITVLLPNHLDQIKCA